jgi:NhaP-type Na+/H+ or K+/H+ antiporter
MSNLLINKRVLILCFRVLLPPIILAATYKMCSRAFIMQFDGIMLLAVLGTLLNVFILAGILYLVDYLGLINSVNVLKIIYF